MIPSGQGDAYLIQLSNFGVQEFLDQRAGEVELGMVYGCHPYDPYFNYHLLSTANSKRLMRGAVHMAFPHHATGLSFADRKSASGLLKLAITQAFVPSQEDVEWAQTFGIRAAKVGGCPAWLAPINQTAVERHAPAVTRCEGEVILQALVGSPFVMIRKPSNNAEEAWTDPMVRLSRQLGMSAALFDDEALVKDGDHMQAPAPAVARMKATATATLEELYLEEPLDSADRLADLLGQEPLV
jgi:hypothetical protein